MFRMAPPRFIATTLLISLGIVASDASAESAVLIPAARVDNTKAPGSMQSAVVAGGCFWGVEGVFEHVNGVSRVVSGYAGGDAGSANYDDVSSGRSGHAESVQITFDPQIISYGEILRIFFSVAHDPTTLNRQGPDTGTQYRSAIFVTDDTQKNIATQYVAQLDGAKVFPAAIVTHIDPLKKFYPAERYHQDFIAKNPDYPYVVFNDLPKIRNLKQTFPSWYREVPSPVEGAKPQ